MTTPVDKAFEAEALSRALSQPLTVNRDTGRTWLTLQFSDGNAPAALVEIDSFDGKVMHVVRTRLVMAAPAAVRLVQLLAEHAVTMPIGDWLFHLHCDAGGRFSAEAMAEFNKLHAEVTASLEGRS